MRVCPQCQYTNPSDYRYCQQCGASLSGGISFPETPKLDTENLTDPVTETDTPNVAESPVTWYVICSPNGSASDRSTPPATPSADGAYLDQSRRYEIMGDVAAIGVNSSGDVEFQVHDLSPDAPSYLEQLYGICPPAAGSESPSVDEVDHLVPAPELTTYAVRPDRDLTLPAIAQLYLSLQHQLYPSLPRIHDAWQQEGNVILLLEDRSALPSILTAMHADSIDPFQVVSWLYYTTKLWELLETYGCGQSLLILDNLRIDEDGIICLQRLYLDSPTAPSTLRHLGDLWHRLLQPAERPYPEPIGQICGDMESSVITTVAQLQERLRLIADDLQSSSEVTDLQLLDLSLSSYGDSQLTMKEHDHDSLQSFTTEPKDLSALDEGESELEDWQKTTRPVPAEQMDTEPDGDDLPTIVLPMQLLSVEDAGRTDIGRQRKDNQDYFAIKTHVRKVESPTGRSLHAQGLYILCDGMGGHAGGEIASTLATQTLEQYFETHWDDGLPDEETIKNGIFLANNAIYDLNVQNMRSGSGRMGTTLVLVLLQGTEVAIAHVGDSRLYRYSRRQGLELLTVDHEVGQRDIQRGIDPVEAYSHPEAYQLTQALGPRDQDFVHPDVAFLEVNEDNIFLLCSDGLTDNDLIETYCQSHVEPLLSSQTSLEQGASQLIELANHYNGHDNISVILIRVRVRPNTTLLRRG